MARLRGRQLVMAQADFEQRIARMIFQSLSRKDVEVIRDLAHSSAGFLYESFRAAAEEAYHTAPSEYTPVSSKSSKPTQEAKKPSEEEEDPIAAALERRERLRSIDPFAVPSHEDLDAIQDWMDEEFKEGRPLDSLQMLRMTRDKLEGKPPPELIGAGKMELNKKKKVVEALFQMWKQHQRVKA